MLNWYIIRILNVNINVLTELDDYENQGINCKMLP